MKRAAASLLTGALLVSIGAGATVAQEKDVIVLKSGTGVVSGHPFFKMVEEYNAANPDVEVRLDIAPWSDETWASLGAGLASGNPPDIMRVSIGGAAGQGALQSPLLIDTTEYMSEDELADYGESVIRNITIGDKQVIWPQDGDWGTMLVANGDMLEAAGIDVAKIQSEGWTFDEFREAAKKLTNGDTYGLGTSAGWAGSLFLDLVWRAGAPDGSANMGAYFWGNEFSLGGAPALAVAELLHAMQYEDMSMPQEVTGLQDHMPLLWSGKVAMINYWHGAIGEIKAYNDSIAKGEVSGEPADFEVVLLPYPYNPETGGAETNLRRVTGLALFRQEPYKGDEHTQNVIDFVKFLTSPENLAAFANWEGTIPAKASALPMTTALESDQISWWADHAADKAVFTFPYGHPAYAQVGSDAIDPNLTALLNNEKSPQQFVDDMTAAAGPILSDWVGQNADAATAWATAPEGWPSIYNKPLSEQ